MDWPSGGGRLGGSIGCGNAKPVGVNKWQVEGAPPGFATSPGSQIGMIRRPGANSSDRPGLEGGGRGMGVGDVPVLQASTEEGVILQVGPNGGF